MQVTRRYWETVAVATGLAVAALVLARPMLLAGTGILGAWLLTRQFRFVRALTTVDNHLTVEQSVPTERTLTDEPMPLTLSARLDGPSQLDLSIQAEPPITASGATKSECTISLSAGETSKTITTTHSYPVAGEFTFDRPAVVVRSQDGLFTARRQRGSTPTVTVDPRLPQRIHVGEGGDRMATVYGEHSTDELGSGLDPAEIREYVPGDAARRIDWKATARLNTPHVREFEVETDWTTALVVDHRDRVGVGNAGETAFDYLREVGIALVSSAREYGDPCGLYAVDDEGLSTAIDPSRDQTTYDMIRRRLLDMRPTAVRAAGDRPRSSPPSRETVARLLDDDTAYGRTLSPYLRSEIYEERYELEPLAATIRQEVLQLDGPLWTVIVTDDQDRDQVRNAVRLARQQESRVTVLLAPHVLFEAGELGDIEAAYERYLEFEEFRRRLSAIDRVTAFEVAPDDRLAALLTSRSQQPARITS